MDTTEMLKLTPDEIEHGSLDITTVEPSQLALLSDAQFKVLSMHYDDMSNAERDVYDAAKLIRDGGVK